MGIKVAKFGGSSVADGIQLTKTKAIIEQDPDRRYIVVSAPGKRFEGDNKITDLLYLCKTHIEHNLPYDQLFQVVADRYMAVEVNLGVKVDLLRYFDEIRENLKKNPSSDYIASRGEYLNAILVAAFLGYDFVDTAELIKFDTKGKLLMEETDQAIREELSKHERAVLPGFYGSTPDGQIKTFSRGGSDVTGSLVAKACHADVYENWTDVSGVYSSDPRYVKSAHVIPMLSYKMVRELSEVGASVFHEEAIAPVVEVNIPINIRNTNSPEDDGTIIGKEPEKKGVVGVSAKGGLSKIYVRKLMFFKESGVRHKVLSLMHLYGIKPCYTLYGCDSISWYFETKQIENIDTEEMCLRIKKEFSLDEIELKKGFAVVGLVGKGIEETMEYVDALDELRKNNIEPSSVSLGGSYTTFVIGVPEDRKLDAVNAISERLFIKK